jgi:hypothetical protein
MTLNKNQKLLWDSFCKVVSENTPDYDAYYADFQDWQRHEAEYAAPTPADGEDYKENFESKVL